MVAMVFAVLLLIQRMPCCFTVCNTETYAEAEEKHREVHSYQPLPLPLSGIGVGLPISRVLARHFGGDLVLHEATVQSSQYHNIKGITAVFSIPSRDLPESLPLTCR
jgi:hypothetical protein